ncbi:hypothetical protein Bca4012_010357 [Brassica carinata]
MSCHILGPGPNDNKEARDVMAHVEKTLRFSPFSSSKRRQPLRFSPETQNAAKPCPVGEIAPAGHQTSSDHCVASPERRSRRVSIPSRLLLKSSSLFFFDPATGFGWKPTLVLVDLVRQEP